MSVQVETASTTLEHTEAHGMAVSGPFVPGEHSPRIVPISAAFTVSPADTKQALQADALPETVGQRQLLFVPHVSAAITRFEH